MAVAVVQQVEYAREAALVVRPRSGRDERHLEVRGELDLATAPAFLSALAFALQARPALVELDLRQLTFIDARCAGAIATASTRVSGWGGTFVAREPQMKVRGVLALCGYADPLWPRETLETPPAAGIV